jgi:hypothetical protein
MKKILYFISALAVVSFMACGSRVNEEKQKKADDSIFQKERNNALDNANKILSDTATAKPDSMARKDTKKKK